MISDNKPLLILLTITMKKAVSQSPDIFHTRFNFIFSPTRYNDFITAPLKCEFD